MYPMRRAVQRNRLRHVDNATFGSTVASKVACPYRSEDTRDVDDPAAVPIWVWILVEHLP